MRESVRTIVVCPKCGTKELEFTEFSEAFEKFTQDEDGKITSSGEDGALLGPVNRVEATCLKEGCGHKWTVRRVTDITDLPNWPKEEGSEPQTDEAEASGDEEETPAAEETKEETKADTKEPKVTKPKAGKGKGGKGKGGKKNAKAA